MSTIFINNNIQAHIDILDRLYEKFTELNIFINLIRFDVMMKFRLGLTGLVVFPSKKYLGNQHFSIQNTTYAWDQ